MKMAVSENDLELLETYLDGELSTAQTNALIDRLRSEPALAAAMESAKAERQIRMAVWTSCEPNEATVEKLLGRVQRKIDNHWSWASRLSKLRMVSGAAACILIGVFMGYAGRTRNQPPTNGPAIVSNNGVVNTAGTTNSGPVEVPIVDEYGRVVVLQRFATEQDAQQFIEEMRQWQEKQDKAPTGGNIVQTQQKF